MKKILKKIFPPPVSSFMREVKTILDSIWRAKGELSAQLERMRKENEALRWRLEGQNVVLTAQKDELKRLRELFESVNRENLRIYNESKKQQEQLFTERNSLEAERDRLAAEQRKYLTVITNQSDLLTELRNTIPEKSR